MTKVYVFERKEKRKVVDERRTHTTQNKKKKKQYTIREQNDMFQFIKQHDVQNGISIESKRKNNNLYT